MEDAKYKPPMDYKNCQAFAAWQDNIITLLSDKKEPLLYI